MIFLKHHHTVRGFSLLGIFVALACIVVIMSIYMSSVQKAVTGGTGTSSKTSVWGMQDQIQLQLISKALTMSAIMGGDSLLIPSDISGSRESFDNTSANFWSALIMENLVKSEQLVMFCEIKCSTWHGADSTPLKYAMTRTPMLACLLLMTSKQATNPL